jgi:hypothetical protein
MKKTTSMFGLFVMATLTMAMSLQAFGEGIPSRKPALVISQQLTTVTYTVPSLANGNLIEWQSYDIASSQTIELTHIYPLTGTRLATNTIEAAATKNTAYQYPPGYLGNAYTTTNTSNIVTYQQTKPVWLQPGDILQWKLSATNTVPVYILPRFVIPIN